MKITKSEFIIGTGAVAVFALALVFLYASDSGYTGTDVAPVDEVPPMTPLMREVLEKSTGFQVLVSYTDEGFQPALASLKVGDTVRFTNNSKKELWVSTTRTLGGEMYAAGSESCGQSDFDSCVRLQPKEFWEFTFEKKGTWGYINITYPSHSAVVNVI